MSSARPHPPQHWWITENGQAAGPYSRAYVQAALRSGTLTPETLVCLVGTTQWRPCSDWPPLARLVPPVPQTASPSTGPPRPPKLAPVPPSPLPGAPKRTKLGGQVLFPHTLWREDPPWTIPWVQKLLLFGVSPLLLLQLLAAEQASLLSVAWAFSIYFGLVWAVVLREGLKPDCADRRLPWKVAAFTALAGAVTVIMISSMPPITFLLLWTETAGLVPRWLGQTLGVGLVEEAVKAVPLLLFVVSQRPHPTTGAYLGAISGLAFGVTEAVVYSQGYAGSHAMGHLSDGAYLMHQLLRFLTLPLLHAAWSGTLGWFLTLARRHPSARPTLECFGLGLAAGLHGTYNTLSESGFGVAVAAGSLMLFVAYVRSTDGIEQRLAPSAES